MKNPHVVLIDNQDSFVYNLVDALADFNTTVFRNTVAPTVETILLNNAPDLARVATFAPALFAYDMETGASLAR